MGKKANLAIYSIVYAIFYSFCLYKNLTGITFPVFAVGSLVFLFLCMKEFQVPFKKDSIPEIIILIAISVAQVFTSNLFLLFFNVIFVFALLFHIALHQFAADAKWSFFQNTINYVASSFFGLAFIYTPFADYMIYKKEKAVEAENGEEKPGFPWYIILVTILCCIPVLGIVILCLATADAVFGNMLDNVFNLKLSWIGSIFLTAFIFLFSYGMFREHSKKPFREEELTAKVGNPLIVVTAGIMFDFVYVIFCTIQIFYLFIGKFTLPEGYTYATYAREGFFQLLFVCMLNVGMVLASVIFFRETKVTKIILTIFCACTYIMTASSAFRMILYIKYYYFSFLRILVLWTLIVIALLLTGLLLQIWKKNFKLFKYSVVVIAALYLALAVFNPDYKIAKWNLANSGDSKSDFFITEETYCDYDYLVWNLSEDAAPILMANEFTQDKYANRWKSEHEERKFNFRNFNYAKYRSDKLINR